MTMVSDPLTDGVAVSRSRGEVDTDGDVGETEEDTDLGGFIAGDSESVETVGTSSGGSGAEQVYMRKFGSSSGRSRSLHVLEDMGRRKRKRWVVADSTEECSSDEDCAVDAKNSFRSGRRWGSGVGVGIAKEIDGISDVVKRLETLQKEMLENKKVMQEMLRYLSEGQSGCTCEKAGEKQKVLGAVSLIGNGSS